MREINHLSLHQWLRSAIPDSQQPTSPIGFLFLKLPPPPCAVLLVLKKPNDREQKYRNCKFFFPGTHLANVYVFSIYNSVGGCIARRKKS